LIPGKDLPDHENNTRQETEEASVSGIEQGGAAQQSVSIAVLPFTNMSNDPEQEYFSDGITEDIITELSKISALLIIARNTTFVYKNKSVDVKQVGRDLGVECILEGSVRKSGTRVRVTAQLIDAVSGLHTWAERYDRELDDLFTLQDEIMREVVSALDIKLLAGEQSRFWSDGTTNLQAWEYFRQARYLLSLYRAEDHPEVIRLTRKALEFDPEYSAAWVLLAGCYQHIDDNSRYSQKERDEAKDLSKQCLQKGLDCDPTNSGGYSLLAMVHLTEGDFDEAVRIANKAFEMAPNHANIAAISAIVLNKCGDPETALGRIQKAIRLCPVHPTWFQMGLGQINRLLGNTDEAIKAYREMINRDPDSMEGHVGLVEMLVRSGRIDEAKAEASEVLKINPNFSISEYTINISYRDSNQIELIKDSLRKVGFAE
jgi:adenylate cyclase